MKYFCGPYPSPPNKEHWDASSPQMAHSTGAFREGACKKEGRIVSKTKQFSWNWNTWHVAPEHVFSLISYPAFPIPLFMCAIISLNTDD